MALGKPTYSSSLQSEEHGPHLTVDGDRLDTASGQWDSGGDPGGIKTGDPVGRSLESGQPLLGNPKTS